MTQTTNTKPKPRKVRGTGTYVGDEFTFTPYEQGEPTQRNVKTTKGGKVYETCSEKKPMKVAYLLVLPMLPTHGASTPVN